MYAIIATGGKQYKVAPGDIIEVEKLPADEGSKVEFSDVLAVSDGGLKVGDAVSSRKVTGTVVEQFRGPKVIVYKYKRKTGYHKKQGHRQSLTRVKIDSIDA